jgi:hypothetical protein
MIREGLRQMPEIDFFRLVTREMPKEILEADFPRLRGHLPIRGGWGYSMEDACIIDRDDPSVNPGIPFNGVGIEYVFAQHRLYEELIIFRKLGSQYAGINHTLQKQFQRGSADRHFDHLVFEVTAFREEDFEELKAEWEGPHGYESHGFDQELHNRKRAERLCKGVTEYWFDITSFFGRGP